MSLSQTCTVRYLDASGALGFHDCPGRGGKCGVTIGPSAPLCFFCQVKADVQAKSAARRADANNRCKERREAQFTKGKGRRK